MTTTEQAPGQAGPRIRLVEDEPRIRDFITRALVTAGYEVAAAGTGTDGLRLALAGDYDLVILDLIMVDVCVRRLRSKLGFELIKTVRGEGYRLAS
jgi:two-component system, OmpR family, response regulator